MGRVFLVELKGRFCYKFRKQINLIVFANSLIPWSFNCHRGRAYLFCDMEMLMPLACTLWRIYFVAAVDKLLARNTLLHMTKTKNTKKESLFWKMEDCWTGHRLLKRSHRNLFLKVQRNNIIKGNNITYALNKVSLIVIYIMGIFIIIFLIIIWVFKITFRVHITLSIYKNLRDNLS